MENIHTLFVGKRIGLITAHPDDDLIHGHAIWAAHAAGAPVRELTATKGRNSTINHRPDKAYVANGYREHEGRDGANHLGIISNDHLDAPDGSLATVQHELVPVVGEWIAHHGIDILLTLGGITDHADHLASAAIARQAAINLWDEEGYAVGILEAQQADSGLWQAHAHPQSQATIFGAARRHVTQMMVSESVQPGWIEVPGGMSVHPDTMAGLDQYPIRRSATYDWLPPAMFGQNIIAEQPANQQ